MRYKYISSSGKVPSLLKELSKVLQLDENKGKIII